MPGNDLDARATSIVTALAGFTMRIRISFGPLESRSFTKVRPGRVFRVLRVNLAERPPGQSPTERPSAMRPRRFLGPSSSSVGRPGDIDRPRAERPRPDREI